MTVAGPELKPATGELWLTDEAFAALAAHVTGRGETPSAASEAGQQLGLLRQAGVLDSNGHGHPAISDALGAIADPAIATVELSYAGKAMRGWVGHENAALLLPGGDDGRRRLMGLPRSWLPEGLSRLVDLSPRPRASPARSVPYEDGALPGVRRHWRLAFHWNHNGVAPAGGNQGATTDSGGQGESTHGGAAGGMRHGAALEVVDTDEEGLWVLAPGKDGALVANPSTPITVWRLIVRLVTRRDATARSESS